MANESTGTNWHEALGRLESRAAGDADAARDVATVAAALADAERRQRLEERLRRNHAALMTLARVDALGSGAQAEALQKITETAADVLGVARSSVWLYNADQTSILCMELYIQKTGTHESGVELKQADFPAYFVALRSERSIAAHDAHTDPRTSCFSAPYLAPLGIGAMLDAPIRAGGRMIGVICNEHVGPARQWTADEEQFAGSLADFIALALESAKRKQTEEELRAVVQALEANAG